MTTALQNFDEQQSLDEAIAQFELRYRRVHEESVRDFAAARPHLAPNLLFELVLLEFRLARESDPRQETEQQIERYPELCDSTELKLALIAIEIETNGDYHDFNRYAQRFPDLKEDIEAICSAFHSGCSALSTRPTLLRWLHIHQASTFNYQTSIRTAINRWLPHSDCR